MAGCATESPRNALQAEVESWLDVFCSAVEHKDAEKVYTMLDDVYTSNFTKDEFEVFFEHNYALFYEYATSIREGAKSFSFVAQAKGDPCAVLEMTFDNDGNWKISDTTEEFVDEQRFKEDLISSLQSSQFSTALSSYSRLKDRFIDNIDQRAILRAIDSIEPHHIRFVGNQAHIEMPDEFQMIMTCTNKFWSIVQCRSLR